MMTKRKKNSTRKALLPSAKWQQMLFGSSLILVLVAGCSSNEPSDVSGPTIYGFVSVEVEEENGAVETDLNAGFLRFDDTRIPNMYLGSIARVLDGEGDDFCLVGNNAEVLDLEFNPEFGETISAGGTLIFTAAMGTYATLEQRIETNPADGSSVIFYELPSGGLADVPPAGLTLAIEGDEFPAFTNVPVPEVPEPMIDFSPAVGEPAGRSTEFSWTPSGVTGARISLGISNATESVDCLLVDDGEFMLFSGGSSLSETFSGTVDDADRDAITLEQTDEHVLIIFAEDDRGS